MRRCIDCGTRCRNRCSGCGKPYCSYCRDHSGYKTCLTSCRAKAQQSQAARAVAQQRAVVAQQPAAYTPPPHLAQFAPGKPGVQGAAPPQTHSMAPKPPRKLLAIMTDAEFKAWQAATYAALSDTRARGEAYLARRRASGQRTSTDIGMERDQVLFEDVLLALEELETLRHMAAQQQQQSSLDSGMVLAPYDKLKP